MSATVVLGWTVPGGSARRCVLHGPATAGRDAGNRIVLPLAEVSRRQLELAPTATGLSVRNISRTVAVQVDGATLSPGAATELAVGGRVTVGSITIEVRAHDAVTPTHTVTCVNASCAREVPAELHDCPWCGRSLAFAETEPGGSV